MARSRQLIIIKTVNPADQDDGDGMPALGSASEVRAALSRYNTGADGAPSGRNASMGVCVMYGPGMIIEMADSGAGGPSARRDDGDGVRQLMVTMTDDDFAFPVLTRMCREQKWTMMDPESGQRLRFGGD